MTGSCCIEQVFVQPAWDLSPGPVDRSHQECGEVQRDGGSETVVDELSTPSKEQDDESPAGHHVLPQLQHEKLFVAPDPEAGGALREHLGGKLSQDMKSAVLLRAVSGQMKTHLNLTLNEGSSYSKIREAIIAFSMRQRRNGMSQALTFSGMSLITSDPNGMMPMEIDRIKGNGKKGKGKSKDTKGQVEGRR